MGLGAAPRSGQAPHQVGSAQEPLEDSTASTAAWQRKQRAAVRENPEDKQRSRSALDLGGGAVNGALRIIRTTATRGLQQQGTHAQPTTAARTVTPSRTALWRHADNVPSLPWWPIQFFSDVPRLQPWERPSAFQWAVLNQRSTPQCSTRRRREKAHRHLHLCNPCRCHLRVLFFCVDLSVQVSPLRVALQQLRVDTLILLADYLEEMLSLLLTCIPDAIVCSDVDEIAAELLCYTEGAVLLLRGCGRLY